MKESEKNREKLEELFKNLTKTIKEEVGGLRSAVKWPGCGGQKY